MPVFDKNILQDEDEITQKKWEEFKNDIVNNLYLVKDHISLITWAQLTGLGLYEDGVTVDLDISCSGIPWKVARKLIGEE